MSYKPRYDRGGWKAVCESCGRIVKASQLQRRWDGYMVDERCFETRQPQDFVRGVADYQAPPFTRPEQSDNFIATEYIYTPNGSLPIGNISTEGTTTLTMVVTRV